MAPTNQGITQALRSPRGVSQLSFLALGCLSLWLLGENRRLQEKVAGGIVLAEMMLAPDFSLPSVGGKDLSLHEFHGRKGTLLFFDPDCDACDRDASNWNSIAQNAHNDGRFFIAVCRGTEEKARRFCARHKLTFPVGVDADGMVTSRYKVPGVPFAYVIDEGGRVGYERTATESNCVRLGFRR
jgi:peroxiredoxin